MATNATPQKLGIRGEVTDLKLTSESHISNVVSRPALAPPQLIKTTDYNGVLKLFETAFKAYVRAKLDYDREIFNLHLKTVTERMEKPQRKYTNEDDRLQTPSLRP